MMVDPRGSILGLLAWQWRYVAWFLAAGTLGWALIAGEHLASLQLPVLPMTVLGAVIGFFVAFRTNSAYDRWWEGRQLWGRLINASRMLASQTLVYLSAAHRDDAHRIVHRHIAYVHALRLMLRKQDYWADEELSRALPDDSEALKGQSNVPHALVQRQLAELAALAKDGALDAERLQSLDRTLEVLIDVQGGCERIKNTPLPRGYTYIAQRLVLAYGVLLPYSLVHDLGWISIPINVLVCLSFALISEAGRVLEDPFTMFWNGLPLSALARTIDRNLRERLGEPDLPELLKPDARGILM